MELTTRLKIALSASRPPSPATGIVRRGEVWPYTYLKAWTRDEEVKPKVP